MATSEISTAEHQPSALAINAELRVLFTLTAACLPLAYIHLRHLWSRPHYQFFPFVLVAVGVLVWQRWPVSDSDTQPAPRTANFFLTCALLLLIVSIAIFSPVLGYIAAVLAVAAGLAHFAGRKFWTDMFPAWLLLWLLVPPPFGLDAKLIEWLQGLTSRAAGLALEFCGVLHLLAGNVIELPGHRLFVEEACSGIQSVIALGSCVAVFCVWTRKRLFVSLVLIASAVFWAGLLNLVRVAFVALALAWWGIDLSSGWRHELLGFILFAVALGMILSTDQFLWLLGVWTESIRSFFGGLLPLRRRRRRAKKTDDPSDTADQSPAAAGGETSSGQTSKSHLLPAKSRLWQSLVLTCILVCLIALQVVILTINRDYDVRLATMVQTLDKTSLPQQADDWQLVDFETQQRPSRSEFGEHSKVWQYQSPLCPAVISFDFPFEGWHDLTRCYKSQGWNMGDYSQHSVPSDSAAELPHVEVEFSKPSGEYGYLLYTCFDQAGRQLRPPVASISMWAKIRSKLLRSPLLQLLRRTELVDRDESRIASYQFQTFVGTDFRLSPEQRDHVRDQFLSLKSEFRDQWDDDRGGQR